MIDSLMLFGAVIEQVTPINYRMILSRRQHQWPALAFALIVCRAQDPMLDFFSFQMCVKVGERAFMQTRPSRFLSQSHKRWYETGKRQIPSDLVLNEDILLFWLVGALNFRGGPGIPKKTDLTLLCRCDTMLRIKFRDKIVELTGWGVETREGSIVLPEKGIGAVRKWLAERVPANVLK